MSEDEILKIEEALREENSSIDKIYIIKLLKIYKKQNKILNNIQIYANREVENYTEDIKDYIDDDKIANKNIIDNLKEDREHWKDVLKLCNDNEYLYIKLEDK